MLASAAGCEIADFALRTGFSMGGLAFATSHRTAISTALQALMRIYEKGRMSALIGDINKLIIVLITSYNHKQSTSNRAY